MGPKHIDAVITILIDKIESLEDENRRKDFEIKSLRESNVELVKALEEACRKKV